MLKRRRVSLPARVKLLAAHVLVPVDELLHVLLVHAQFAVAPALWARLRGGRLARHAACERLCLDLGGGVGPGPGPRMRLGVAVRGRVAVNVVDVVEVAVVVLILVGAVFEGVRLVVALRVVRPDGAVRALVAGHVAVDAGALERPVRVALVAHEDREGSVELGHELPGVVRLGEGHPADEHVERGLDVAPAVHAESVLRRHRLHGGLQRRHADDGGVPPHVIREPLPRPLPVPSGVFAHAPVQRVREGLGAGATLAPCVAPAKIVLRVAAQPRALRGQRRRRREARRVAFVQRAATRVAAAQPAAPPVAVRRLHLLEHGVERKVGQQRLQLPRVLQVGAAQPKPR
mmetsp:Transcript_23239/g.72573  ORF Transcript_23239/g.72573 Transcript_23239/m.72573 type:complete len:346 (+) Transcript_23239:2839-3876(+)